MALPQTSVSLEDLVSQATATAKSLTVAELKNALRAESEHVSGIKSELQLRLIGCIRRAQNDRDRARLDRIRAHMTPGRHSYNNPYPSPFSNHTPTSSLSPQYAPTPSRLLPPNGYNMHSQRNPFQPQRVAFKDSPFYTIRYPLADVLDIRARESTRDTARLQLNLPQNVVNELSDEKSNARVMVFCAADGKPDEIAFPHQVELKCNDTEVKASLRGLKNKPGTTRPADITHLLRRKHPHLNNTVEMTYALTTKKFFMVVNLVNKKPVEQLVNELQAGKSLSKERILAEMQKQAADPDIVATSAVMSLKCPISYTRIKTPCRGIGCNHNQCFDAASYLQLQEQAPTWTCPVCNKEVRWKHLVLDLYMKDILQATSTSTEEVTIEPDGRWHIGKDAQSTPVTKSRPNPSPSDEADSDALEIIDDPEPYSFKLGYRPAALTPASMQTPPLNSQGVSRPSSTAPGSASRSNKRPAAEVIDLTLSEDEEDQPPIKRQRPSMSSSTTSFHPRPPDFSKPTLPGLNGDFLFTMPPPNPPSPFDYDARYGSSF